RARSETHRRRAPVEAYAEPRCRRSRSHHPDRWRAAAVELPPLRRGVRRAGVHRPPLAGLRRERLVPRDRELSAPGSAVRTGDDREPWGGSRELSLAQSNLTTRVMTALVGAPLILVLLYLGPAWGWFVFVAIAMAVGALELFAMTHPGDRIAQGTGI